MLDVSGEEHEARFRCHRAVRDQRRLQSLVRLPACAAGRRLMKTSCEPSTTGVPLAVPSPTRAAGLSAITASGLPVMMAPEGWAAAIPSPPHTMKIANSEKLRRMVDLMAHLLRGVAAIIKPPPLTERTSISRGSK